MPKCPAKINYSLKIVRKRPDGFHNIESVMQTISLYDYLLINLEESDINQIYLSGSNDEVPYDESNLVYKAAKLFIDSLNIDKEELFKVIDGYTKALDLLDSYDHQTLIKPKGSLPSYIMTYEEARGIIDSM